MSAGQENTASVAWLFPGQGSQSVGIGRALLESAPAARDIFEMAEQMSGLPLRALCLQGPESQLIRTDVAQPVITALSLGYSAHLLESGEGCDHVAGHSLGEFPALCVAGVLTLEDTLRLVVARSRLMQRAAEARPGGMLAVADLNASMIEEEVARWDPEDLVVATENAPGQRVLAGVLAAIEEVAERLEAKGALCTRLPVAGAWHSPLMTEAAGRFAELLDTVPLRDARVPVWLGDGGGPRTDRTAICAVLRSQIVRPVRWESSVLGLYGAGVRDFVEVGPGRVLRGLVRRILSDSTPWRLRGADSARPFEHPYRAVGRAA